MQVVTTRAALEAVLDDEERGLVPTMGALHAGHRALIEQAADENPVVVVSIFVNPTQFNDPRDLATYPRTFEQDLAIAEQAGATLIFAPELGDVYLEGFATSVAVDRLSQRWEGAARPGHFQGVATVVTVLLNLVRPAHSYFGEKDFQQLQIIQRMARDLALPGAIVGCPTVRDVDGLALSSRNVRLSSEARAQAVVLPETLAAIAEQVRAGVTGCDELLRMGRQRLESTPGVSADYLAIVNEETLEPVDEVGERSRVIAAIKIGGVRLIDNRALGPGR